MGGESMRADFVGGYAAGWVYRVPEAFRSALGIEWGTRRVGGAQVHGWVQRSALRFKEGDLLHHASDGSLVQVQEAAPAPNGVGGLVRWNLLRPGAPLETMAGSQAQFLHFLQCGSLGTIL